MIDRIPKPGDILWFRMWNHAKPIDTCLLYPPGKFRLWERIRAPTCGWIIIISVARDLHRGHWFDRVTFMYNGHLFEYD